MHSRLLLFPTFVLLVVAMGGCDSVDRLSTSEPTVSYASTTLDADFYRPGSSGTPTIDWNGAQGTISLGSSVEGLSINSTTGQLTWTKLLPPGTHEVEVVVGNSEGQVAVPITIENPLSGLFEGTYSGSAYYALDVEADGTVAVHANSSTNPVEGAGTWEVVDGLYVFDYVYEETDEAYHVIAEVEQTGAAATVEGEWYVGAYPSEGNAGGSVSVSMD